MLPTRQRTICCCGWCILQNYSCSIWCTAGIGFGIITAPCLHQLRVVSITNNWFKANNICWWHSSVYTYLLSRTLWSFTERHWCYHWMHKSLSLNSKSMEVQVSYCIKEETIHPTTRGAAIGWLYVGTSSQLPLFRCSCNFLVNQERVHKINLY